MTCLDCNREPEHGTVMIAQYVGREVGKTKQRFEFEVCGECLRKRHATKEQRA